MKIDKAIKFMKYLDDVTILEQLDGSYDVMLKQYDDELKPISCNINGDTITYSMGDVYDNGCDYEEIDFDQLNKLQEFVKILKEIGD